VAALAVSADGTRVASAGDDEKLVVLDARSGRKLVEAELETKPYAVAFSPTGDVVAVGVMTHVRLYRARDLALIAELDASWYAGVFALAWSPDGKRLATTAGDDLVRVWDVAARRELPLRAGGHAWHVRRVGFVADGKIATAEARGPLRVWDAKTGRAVRMLGDSDRNSAFAVTKDGSRWAVVSEGVNLLDAVGRVVKSYGSVFPGDVAFSPDGRSLAFASGHAVIVVDARGVDDERWKLSFTVTPGRQLLDVEGLAWTPDGATLVCALDDGSVRWVDAASGRETRAAALSWDEHSGTAVHAVAVSPDGATVAAAHGNGVVYLLRAADGKLVRAMPGHDGVIYGVAFSPDGSRIASGGMDGTVRVWDVASRKELRRYAGHVGMVFSVAWSPDGALVASAGADTSVLLWPGR
jgi:WD40 repeat protein